MSATDATVDRLLTSIFDDAELIEDTSTLAEVLLKAARSFQGVHKMALLESAAGLIDEVPDAVVRIRLLAALAAQTRKAQGKRGRATAAAQNLMERIMEETDLIEVHADRAEVLIDAGRSFTGPRRRQLLDKAYRLIHESFIPQPADRIALRAKLAACLTARES